MSPTGQGGCEVATSRAELADAKRSILEAKQDILDLLGLWEDNRRLQRALAETKAKLEDTDRQFVAFVLGPHAAVCSERDTLKRALDALGKSDAA